mgnify:CR=1 FL=1
MPETETGFRLGTLKIGNNAHAEPTAITGLHKSACSRINRSADLSIENSRLRSVLGSDEEKQIKKGNMHMGEKALQNGNGKRRSFRKKLHKAAYSLFLQYFPNFVFCFLRLLRLRFFLFLFLAAGSFFFLFLLRQHANTEKRYRTVTEVLPRIRRLPLQDRRGAGQ